MTKPLSDTARAARWAEIEPRMRDALSGQNYAWPIVQCAVGCIVEYGDRSLKADFYAGSVAVQECLRAYARSMAAV